jgi:hypothetical protein
LGSGDRRGYNRKKCPQSKRVKGSRDLEGERGTHGMGSRSGWLRGRQELTGGCEATDDQGASVSEDRAKLEGKTPDITPSTLTKALEGSFIP